MNRAMLASLLAFGFILTTCAASFAEEPSSNVAGGEAVGQTGGTSSPAASPASPPKFPPYAEVLKDAEKKEGLIKLHLKGPRLFAELAPNQLNRDFIVLTSIAKGIAKGHILGGMSLNFGDDWLWQFRKVDDRIQIVRRNVRFTADKSKPEARAVNLAYTDSILFSLPIVTNAPSGGYVIDLTPVFMSDLPQISHMLPGFSFASDRSSWAAWKPMTDNVELEVAATYASSGLTELDSVIDTRGATINVHYSISLLPQTGYQPRIADDRVGYFITVIKDFSRKEEIDRFVRYINRWDLRKSDSSAAISPPTKPIVFWLEKSIPYAYRQPIREGISEWNKAFEKAGFASAIEVRQQPDNADWDPEDINYNTIRWSTSGTGIAMGPSRVNAMTGQILDADIIFDSDFLQFWKETYEMFTPASIAEATGGPLDIESFQREQAKHQLMGKEYGCTCCIASGFGHEMALGATAMLTRTIDPASREKLVMQGLKELTMHEVGHTLGLRHNFKASAMLTLEEMNDVTKTKETGLTSSVMDYTPVNFMPQGKTQGDFYSTTIGPYDMWAIEYGYKPFSGNEEAELKKIASRSGEPQLAFATDEDTRGIDSDPLSNRFDMGKDPIQFARVRAQLVAEMWPKVTDLVTKDGEGYQQARKAFGVLLKTYGTAMHFVSRNIGGIYVSRSHKGDANASAPYVVVDAAKQRESMALLEELVFSDKPFQFPPQFYNFLPSTHWDHWGSNVPLRNDLPVHQQINAWQDRILQQILSPLTLTRVHDAELKVASDQDAFTVPELFDRLTKTIYAELDKLPDGEFTNRKPAISSLRRNLQRTYLQYLSQIAMGNSSAPEDCQTVAYAELQNLKTRIDGVLSNNGSRLDTYTKAHLTETRDRVGKVLDARLQLSHP